jgi:hypothetical protein
MASGDAGEILRQIADLKRDISAIQRSVNSIENLLRGQASFRGTKSSYDRP